MNFIKIRISDDIEKIETDLISSIDKMFRLISPRFSSGECMWSPHIDIYETAGEVIVLADLAGVKKEHIHLEVGRRTLKISGIRTEQPSTKQMRYRLAEISYGYFERCLSLPVQIDPNSASASYTEGILQITLAKMPLDNFHKITIQNDR
jgi:HSP20 family protein